jgi:hypothetical protein
MCLLSLGLRLLLLLLLLLIELQLVPLLRLLTMARFAEL